MLDGAPSPGLHRILEYQDLYDKQELPGDSAD